MSKVLITGVAGLLGFHLSRHLLDKGHEVIGVDNFSGGYRDFVDPRVRFFDFDLISPTETSEMFSREKPDYVYHFAAYAAEGLSPFIRNFNYSNNLLCSVNIINECIKHGVKKIIFTSSMAVYGIGEPPFTELQQPRPEDPYGIAKYAVEMDLKLARDQFGLDYSIARPHNVIGIQQNIWDKYRNVIGIWIRKALAGENLTIFGDGEQTRAFSDIKFYLEPLEKLMTNHGGETFNLGSDKEITLNDMARLVQKIAQEFGYNPDIEHLEARHEVKHAFCDHTKAKNMLDFRDETDLEQTVREMFAWAKDQPEREVKQMPYELEKGMYSFWK